MSPPLGDRVSSTLLPLSFAISDLAFSGRRQGWLSAGRTPATAKRSATVPASAAAGTDAGAVCADAATFGFRSSSIVGIMLPPER
jgi:hypothetical protein